MKKGCPPFVKVALVYVCKSTVTVFTPRERLFQTEISTSCSNSYRWFMIPIISCASYCVLSVLSYVSRGKHFIFLKNQNILVIKCSPQPEESKSLWKWVQSTWLSGSHILIKNFAYFMCWNPLSVCRLWHRKVSHINSTGILNYCHFGLFFYVEHCSAPSKNYQKRAKRWGVLRW